MGPNLNFSLSLSLYLKSLFILLHLLRWPSLSLLQLLRGFQWKRLAQRQRRENILLHFSNEKPKEWAKSIPFSLPFSLSLFLIITIVMRIALLLLVNKKKERRLIYIQSVSRIHCKQQQQPLGTSFTSIDKLLVRLCYDQTKNSEWNWSKLNAQCPIFNTLTYSKRKCFAPICDHFPAPLPFVCSNSHSNKLSFTLLLAVKRSQKEQK